MIAESSLSFLLINDEHVNMTRSPRTQLALLGNGISTIGFPCNDVSNRTVHTYIHTNIRSVSSPGSFTAPILKMPPPAAARLFFKTKHKLFSSIGRK